MQNTTVDIPTADELAEMADRGEDISQFFSTTGAMKYPIQQVQLNVPAEMASELDELAHELNITMQSVILSYLRQALDQHYLAKQRIGNFAAGRLS